MNRYKGILLDLDNTLYDYAPCHTKALDMVLIYFGRLLDKDSEFLHLIHKEARQQIHEELTGTAASHNRLLYFQRMLEIVNYPSVSDALEGYYIYWDAFIAHIKLFDGVEEFLKNNNAKIAMVTDLTADVQHKKIHYLKLDQYIDCLVTSEEAGQEKPSPEIFHKALEKLKLSSDQVCMIGDSYEKDILGANALGIPTYWVNHNNEKRDLVDGVIEVKAFKELLTLCK